MLRPPRILLLFGFDSNFDARRGWFTLSFVSFPSPSPSHPISFSTTHPIPSTLSIYPSYPRLACLLHLIPSHPIPSNFLHPKFETTRRKRRNESSLRTISFFATPGRLHPRLLGLPCRGHHPCCRRQCSDLDCWNRGFGNFQHEAFVERSVDVGNC